MTDMIDVSSNNHGNSPIDWVAVKAAGINYAYIKAGEGTNPAYSNPFMVGDLEHAQAAGILCGLYWFYNEGIPVATQANIFAGYLANYPTDLVPMFDYEVGNPNANIRDYFLSAIPTCGQYVDRSFFDTIGPNGPLWLAWPGWNGEPVSAAIVQTGSQMVAGLPNDETDVNTVLIPSAILKSTPVPPTPPIPMEEEDMPLYCTNSAKTGFVVAADLSRKVGLPDVNDANALLATNIYHEVQLTDELLAMIPG